MEENDNINLALLQIGSMPVRPGLPSSATLLFNRPIRSLMPKVSRTSTKYNQDEDNQNKLKM